MHVQVLITFSLVSHCEQKISRYTYFELRASFAGLRLNGQRNASVDRIDFMLVQPNVLQQDGRIPAPLECYIKCPTTLNFLNNKFPPLENIRTSKCPNYARGGRCYTFVLIGA